MSDLADFGYLTKDQVTLLREAGIRCKARPAFGKWWKCEVPHWVKEAIDLYRKRKGYAGLTEIEFILKMRP